MLDTILTHVLGSCLTSLHAKRAAALLRATSALLCGSITSLSAIALYLDSATTLKHRIKSADRLLGNSGLHLARGELYRGVAQCWLQGLPQLLVVVDWSDLSRDQRWQLLRASVVVEGRSVTLYEEVHPQKLLANADVHRRFLQRLSGILPDGHAVDRTDRCRISCALVQDDDGARLGICWAVFAAHAYQAIVSRCQEPARGVWIGNHPFA